MEYQKHVPLYRQVAETIRGRILSCQYRPGDLIPSFRELEAEFGVSNITIRKALALLNQEGLVESRQGVGTIVAFRERDMVQIEITGNFKEWLDSASGRKPKLEARVLESGLTIAPRRVHELLGAPLDQKAYRMKRLRSYKGRPVSFFVNYSFLEGCGRIDPGDVERLSFIEVFRDACDVRLTHIEQRMQAITADLDLAPLLQVDFGAPVFFAENVYYSADSKAVQVTYLYYRGDRYIYKASIPLNDSEPGSDKV